MRNRYPRSRQRSGDETDTRDRARIAAAAADAKKAHDVVILDVGEIMGIADAFVIASAPNTRQVRTIVDEIEKCLREQDGSKPRAVEGIDDATWALLDYGDLVVHVFLEETRQFYGLERLWSDAPRVPWEGAAAAS